MQVHIKSQVITRINRRMSFLLALLLVAGTAVEAAGQERQQRGDRHERSRLEKERRDNKFRELYEGVLDMQKTSYKSRIGELEIPVYVFQPLEKRGARGHAALIWVHGGVHSNWGINRWPFP